MEGNVTSHYSVYLETEEFGGLFKQGVPMLKKYSIQLNSSHG